MKSCELHELQISALLDGEADLHEQVAVTEHLLECDDCRRFFQDAREFQGQLDDLPLDAALDRGAPAAPRHFRRNGLPGWAQAAAMLTLLALGIALGVGIRSEELPPERVAMPSGEETIDVRLASDSGSMNDAEFLGLALDLLRADGRYQRKMYEILDLLEMDDPRQAEGGIDFALDREQTDLGAQRVSGGESGDALPAARRAIY